jgi:hypothetical protein
MSSEPEQKPREYAPSYRARRFRPSGIPQRSQRRMSVGRQLWYGFLVAMLRLFLGLLWASCRVRVVRGAEHLEAARRAGTPAVIVYWHQMQVFCAWLLRRQARAGMKLAVLTSPSVSGEVPAAIITAWGMQPLRGSSTRSSGEALRDMYNVVNADGNSLVLTADGPKGPRHEFKPGAILVAKMARVPVIPMAYAASPCKRWNSWDEFMLPLPFSRVAIVVGEPWQVPAGFAMADLPKAARELEERLKALTAEAAQLL